MLLNGYKIVVAQDRPRMQLSERVPVTDEFRAEINAWMVEFFGMTCIIERGQVLTSELMRTMFVHPADYQELKREFGGAA